ncbi:MAG TPA: hypothetical protein DGZ34_02655, partial [Lachnospiraceae bacterium]|nr:hypothetical protein [Lachnospiraceae bacterium]
MKKKIVFILSLSCCMFLLGGCSEAKQEKQKTNNPIAYTSTEFETTEIPAQEESYVLHASKIHSKSPTALETAINNIIRDAKGYEDEHEKFIGFLDCAVDDENLPAFYGQQTIIVSEKSIYYWNISANKVDMRGSARYVFPENTKGCACVRFINDGQRVSAAGLEEVDSAIAELLQKNPKEQYVFLNGISREEYPSTEPLLLNAKNQ